MANPPPPPEPEPQEMTETISRLEVARVAWALLLKTRTLPQIRKWLNDAENMAERSEQQRVKQLFE